jgi:hypothetical protein
MLILQEIKFDVVMLAISWICELILILLWLVWEPYRHGPCGSSLVLGQIYFARRLQKQNMRKAIRLSATTTTTTEPITTAREDFLEDPDIPPSERHTL